MLPEKLAQLLASQELWNVLVLQAKLGGQANIVWGKAWLLFGLFIAVLCIACTIAYLICDAKGKRVGAVMGWAIGLGIAAIFACFIGGGVWHHGYKKANNPEMYVLEDLSDILNYHSW